MTRTRYVDTVPTVREAAWRVLAQVGVDRLTIRAVAAEASVSPQSFYNRFGTREMLLDDLATAGYRQLSAAMLGHGTDTLASVADPIDRLTEVFRRFRTFAVTDPNRHRFLFDDPMPWRSHRTREAAAEVFDLVVAVTRYAVDHDDLVPGDPAELTLRLWAAAQGSVQLELMDDDRRPGRRPQLVDAEATMATMIRGLRPRRTLSSGNRR